MAEIDRRQFLKSAAATAGAWTAVGLGPRILRVETAAVALAATILI